MEYSEASTGDASGDNPTQNCVDNSKPDGAIPLTLRKPAGWLLTALGHYNEQGSIQETGIRGRYFYHPNDAEIPGFITAKIYYESIPRDCIFRTS